MVDFTDGTITEVEDSEGRSVPVANDDEVQETATGVDINADTETVTVDCPDAATTLTVLVDPEAAAHLEIEWQDTDGNTVISRGTNENEAFASTGGSQIFAVATVATGTAVVRLVDDSGGSNAVNYAVRCI